jgi:hypothetical protein
LVVFYGSGGKIGKTGKTDGRKRPNSRASMLWNPRWY